MNADFQFDQLVDARRWFNFMRESRRSKRSGNHIPSRLPPVMVSWTCSGVGRWCVDGTNILCTSLAQGTDVDQVRTCVSSSTEGLSDVYPYTLACRPGVMERISDTFPLCPSQIRRKGSTLHHCTPSSLRCEFPRSFNVPRRLRRVPRMVRDARRPNDHS